VATAFVFSFRIFWRIGWLLIPWCYASEVTTARIRLRGQALGFCELECVLILTSPFSCFRLMSSLSLTSPFL
jgi:hypothetical protein